MLQLSIQDIRALTGTLSDNFFYTTDKGQEGVWRYDAASAETDNLGTILNTADGKVIKRIFQHQISVNWFGAVADFDLSTGAGTDNTNAFQAAFDYACSLTGCVICVPPGRYYIGDYEDVYTGIQLILGSKTISNAANNITLEGKGAEIFGNAGRTLVVANANNVTINGLKIWGFTGGTLGPFRENNALIAINYSSENIIVDNVYLTNTLGDCIYIGGDLDTAGGGTGHTVKNVKIINSTLKERIGNGYASSDPDHVGTRSREAVALIDCLNVEIVNNSIYGSIDIEPNLSDQYIANITIQSNLFLQGKVTPQTVIGTNYWYDEPIVLTGGTPINNDIKLQGIPGAPIIYNNVVQNNNIDNGAVTSSYVYRWDKIASNSFRKGEIRLASDNLIGNLSNTLITNNVADDVFTESNSFITFAGQTSNCIISDNVVYKAGAYCIGIGTPSIGGAFDQGNVFVNNLALNSSDTYYGVLNESSVMVNDYNAVSYLTGTKSISGRIAVGSNIQPYNNFEIFRNGGVGFNFSNNGLTTGSVMQLQSGTAAASNWVFLDAYAAAVNVFRVFGNGNVVNTNNSYGAISDIALKENISSARNYLDDFLKLNVVKYSFKDEHSENATQLGLIAQELEKVFPSMVETVYQTNGLNSNSTGVKSIKYSVFIPMLIKCIQELHEKLEERSA